ncbi:MAG: aminotransferase class V-fold PLP-dependent enzyme [Rhodospirillales bacterium]
MNNSIYLDYQATTPIDPRALDAMLPFFREDFGNPHSTQHSFGQRAEAAVESARSKIANLIGAEARELIFTSGATESNNIAIIGASRFRAKMGDGVKRVIVFAFEHKCVLEAARSLKGEGFTVEVLPVTPDGFADLDALKHALRTPASVVSLMAANNEIGTIQPIEKAGELTRSAGALLHVDAAQAVGKIPLSLSQLNADLLSISAHKMYGPKGVGALYVRRRPRARILPLFQGGGQERGLRSGTIPAALCVGFGAAAEIALENMTEEAERLQKLRTKFCDALDAAGAKYKINGSMTSRLPGNLNISFDNTSALHVMQNAPNVAISTGSACSSASVEPSYVLQALGVDDIVAAGALRIGFGRMTTEVEVELAARELAAAARSAKNQTWAI